MKPAEYYAGREQTYLKHFFLERYLEAVAYHIGWFQQEFVYVDGFSGPWRAVDEELADTSFRIALDKLNYVRNGLAAHRRYASIRAIFVEKDRSAFASLEQAIQQHKGAVKVQPLYGRFDERVGDILNLVGSAFTLFFVDPSGWTGFPMEAITPILLHRPGEVIINFMYDGINRFLDSSDPATEASFDRLFGRSDWRILRTAPDRERAIVDFYRESIREVGKLDFVTSTRILKPTHDRAYYHLVYGTCSPKGILKFRETEKKFVAEQEQVRHFAKREARVDRTGQAELNLGLGSSPSKSLEEERGAQALKAEQKIQAALRSGPQRYESVLPGVLELPLFWESDFKKLLIDMKGNGRIEFDGFRPRERVPKPGCTLRLLP